MTVWRRVYGYGSFRDCASAHSRAQFDVESVEVDESVVVVESVMEVEVEGSVVDVESVVVEESVLVDESVEVISADVDVSVVLVCGRGLRLRRCAV